MVNDMSSKVDMINGSLKKNIILFAIPVILTGVLQLFYNACDLMVVGKFAGSKCVAAVGATSSLISLMVCLFNGLSVGVNVLAAQFFGAKNEEKFQKNLHTSILLSIICGIGIAIIAIFTSRACLAMMNTPEDIIDLSTIYMKIYFIGIPGTMVYNFGSAVLRAQGNSRHPLIFLTISGIVNVILNVILVTLFHLSVEGVAIATAVAQYLSAFFIIRYLYKYNGLKFKKLKIDLKILKNIILIGVPSGINGICFSFANMQIQSAVNIFGSLAVSGSAASASIEGFVYISMNAMQQAALNFTGQNYGAGKIDNIDKVVKISLLYVTIIGMTLSAIMLVFKRPLFSLYLTDSVSIDYGILRMNAVLYVYFICGCMEVMIGVLRGLGYSTLPMIISVGGICGLRVLWIETIFRKYTTLSVLYLSWPVSWIVTIIPIIISYIVIRKKLSVTAVI